MIWISLVSSTQVTGNIQGCQITFGAQQVYPVVPVNTLVKNQTQLSALMFPNVILLPSMYTTNNNSSCATLQVLDGSLNGQTLLTNGQNQFVPSNNATCATTAGQSHFVFQIVDAFQTLHQLNLFYICPPRQNTQQQSSGNITQEISAIGAALAPLGIQNISVSAALNNGNGGTQNVAGNYVGNNNNGNINGLINGIQTQGVQINANLNNCLISFQASQVIPTVPVSSFVNNATKLATLMYPNLIVLPTSTYSLGNDPNCAKLQVKDVSLNAAPTQLTVANKFTTQNQNSCSSINGQSNFMIQITDSSGKINELNLFYVCPQPNIPILPQNNTGNNNSNNNSGLVNGIQTQVVQINSNLANCLISLQANQVVPAVPVSSYVTDPTKLSTLMYPNLITIPTSSYSIGNDPNCSRLQLLDNSINAQPTLVTVPDGFQTNNISTCATTETQSHFTFKIMDSSGNSNLLFLYYVCPQPNIPIIPTNPVAIPAVGSTPQTSVNNGSNSSYNGSNNINIPTQGVQINANFLNCMISFSANQVIPVIPVNAFVTNSTKLSTLIYPNLVVLPNSTFSLGSDPNCAKLQLKDSSGPTLITTSNRFVINNIAACSTIAAQSHFLFQITDSAGKLHELNLYYVCPQQNTPIAPNYP